jgi:predicted DNA-binding protein
MNITATPHRQFPLRLNASLAEQLDRVSKETQIPKTRIATIGLEKFLAELETSGIRSAMRDVCEV